MLLRTAIRQLRHRPGFTLTAVVSMSTAIALNTLMFGVVDALVNPVMPFPGAKQLFLLEYIPGEGRTVDSKMTFDLLGTRAPALQSRADLSTNSSTVAMAEGQQLRTVTAADEALFRVLGTQPVRGRLVMTAAEIQRGESVAVLNQAFAARLGNAFDGMAAAITVEGVTYTVIGVAPSNGGIPRQTDIWLLHAKPVSRSSLLVVRTKHVLTEAELLKELEPVRRELDAYSGTKSHISSWFAQSLVGGRYRTPTFVAATTWAIIALLLLATANLSSVQLARVVQMSREYALRSVLGATSRQVALAASAEIIVLSAVSFAVGLILCAWGFQLVRAVMPPTGEYAQIASVHLHWRVVSVGALVTLITGVLVSVIPAYYATRQTGIAHLPSVSIVGSSKRVKQVFGALIVCETALALALVASSGLLVESARQLNNVDWGYDARNLVTAELRVPVNQGIDSARAVRLMEDLLVEARRHSRVAEGALLRRGSIVDRTISVGNADGSITQKRGTDLSYFAVTGRTLQVLRLPLTRGTGFDSSQSHAGGQVIVDELAAEWLWPKQNPIGRIIKFGPPTSPQPWRSVVGVSRRAILRLNDLRLGSPPLFLIDAGPGLTTPGLSRYSGRLLLRAQHGTASVLTALQRQSLHSPAGITLVQPQLWADYTGFARLQQVQRFVSTVFAVFALAGLFLAAVGIYGVLSYLVESHRREFGIRMALGSQQSDIMRVVFTTGLRPTLVGVALGILLANWSTAILSGYVVRSETNDWLILSGAAIVITAVALSACTLPALRAVRAHVGQLLRAE